jgi:hypothetical protein
LTSSPRSQLHGPELERRPLFRWDRTIAGIGLSSTEGHLASNENATATHPNGVQSTFTYDTLNRELSASVHDAE